MTENHAALEDELWVCGAEAFDKWDELQKARNAQTIQKGKDSAQQLFIEQAEIAASNADRTVTESYIVTIEVIAASHILDDYATEIEQAIENELSGVDFAVADWEGEDIPFEIGAVSGYTPKQKETS